MGIGNSKLKKKLKQTVIVNSNASEFLCAHEEKSNSSDDIDGCEQSTPVLKWHKANQKEEMIKIQQEAEIRDIEAIYENSCLRGADIFNMMPDHYWTGKENKLPRYFRYQGDYPDKDGVTSNLQRLKSSSLNDLINSHINFETDLNHNINVSLHSRAEISSSCPQITMIPFTCLSKMDKILPKKGILKNRNIYRPNSATLLDMKKPTFKAEPNENIEFFPENTETVVVNLRKRIVMFEPSDNPTINHTEISNNHTTVSSEHNNDNQDNPAFSGYFDLSPCRFPDGSAQILKVNVNKKSLIKINLDKRLNMRPSSMDLANRNILHDENGFNRQYDFEKTRCVLNEKLSVRPTVTELKKKKIIKFNDFIEVQETDNYDRTINKTWTRLTEYDKEHIRLELNQFKEKEMKIHSKSKRFTKFHDMHDD